MAVAATDYLRCGDRLGDTLGVSLPGEAWETVAPNDNVLALKADRGLTLGTGVSAWGDQSDQSNDVSQGLGSRQPVRVRVDARHGLFFDGSNDSLGNSTGVTGIANDDEVTVFIVARLQALDATNYCYLETTNAFNTPSRGVLALHEGSTERYLYRVFDSTGANQHQIFNATPAPDTNVRIAELTHSNSSTKLWVDGTLSGEDTSPTLTLDTQIGISVGAQVGATNYFKGDILEVLMYNEVLTDEQRDEIRHRLGRTYGRAVV